MYYTIMSKAVRTVKGSKVVLIAKYPTYFTCPFDRLLQPKRLSIAILDENQDYVPNLTVIMYKCG